MYDINNQTNSISVFASVIIGSIYAYIANVTGFEMDVAIQYLQNGDFYNLVHYTFNSIFALSDALSGEVAKHGPDAINGAVDAVKERM